MDKIKASLVVLAGLAERDRETVLNLLRNGAARSPRGAAYAALADIVEAARGELATEALARSSDPGTSREAAQKATFKLNETRMTVLRFAAEQEKYGGFIDDELRHQFANGETLRKRRSDLTGAGYLAAVEGQAWHNQAGNREQVWRITAKGREAL